jgi:putative flippase GtrA
MINELWHKVDSQFIRFVLVGILNTAFGYGVYCLMIWIGVPYWWATLISNVLGVLFNFKTIGILVFENSSNRLFFRFVSCYVLAYCLNVGIIYLLTNYAGLNDYWSGLIATPFVALFSFFYQKLFVFNHKKHEKN